MKARGDATLMKNSLQRSVRTVKPSIASQSQPPPPARDLSPRPHLAGVACRSSLSVQGFEDPSEDTTPIPSPRSSASAARRRDLRSHYFSLVADKRGCLKRRDPVENRVGRRAPIPLFSLAPDQRRTPRVLVWRLTRTFSHEECVNKDSCQKCGR